MSVDADYDPNVEYKQLLSRKHALEQMIMAADRVERLHSGLQAAVQMGKPTNMIGKSALRFYEGLSESIRVQPSIKIRELLKQLEARMAASLQMVMEYADKESEQALDSAVEDEVNNLINNFRRTSWTAVSLRILLNERGESTSAAVLPVEQAKLREKASEIAEKEKNCRVKVEADIEKVRSDASDMLKIPGLPDAMRDMLRATVSQMDENLNHVRSGKSIESLPHTVEVVELSEEMEIQPIAVEEKPQQQSTGKGAGLAGQLDNWLNSPWDVSWDEAKGKAPKKG